MFRTDADATGRLGAFSDGVLAIVITLLVLEIHVPRVAAEDGARWRALSALLPVVGAWAISFVFVLIYWAVHHYMPADPRRVDRGLSWLNELFLFFVRFMSFPAALRVAWFASRAATFLMSVVMLIGVGMALIWPWVSLGIQVLVPVIYFLPARGEVTNR